MRFIFIVFCVLLSGVTQADSTAQQHFQQAEAALTKENITGAKQHQSYLAGHPLQSYLAYRLLATTLPTQSTKTISQFLSKYEGRFFAEKLRNKWLKQLAKNEQWGLFLQHYREVNNTALRCHNLNALIRTGHKAAAHPQVAGLWLVGKSQPAACNPVFASWQRAGGLTRDLRRQRWMLALEENQFPLALHLAKSLTSTTQQTKSWQAMHKSPAKLLANLPVDLRQDTDITRQILQHGIARLARKNSAGAYQHWQQLSAHYQFTVEQENAIQNSIGYQAALSRKPQALRYFGDATGSEWKARAALWQGKWQVALDTIEGLEADKQETLRWQYWRGRALMKLGNDTAARAVLTPLAKERDYYGFLAADQIGTEYQFNHYPFAINAADLVAFKQRPAIQQLHEFYQLELTGPASSQLGYMKRNYSEAELQMLATTVHDWGWHHVAIALIGHLKAWDTIDIRFPPLFAEALSDAGQRVKLDPNWLLGLARQESAFNVRAKSRTGARGLMQLMPATAREMARKLGLPLKSLNALYEPKVNIPLGSGYLRQVYDQHQHNEALASASYNAGPHRVTKWLPPRKMAADVWAENIPFTETRGYVRRVMMYAAVFEHQRGEAITPLSQRMPPVRPRSQ